MISRATSFFIMDQKKAPGKNRGLGMTGRIRQRMRDMCPPGHSLALATDRITTELMP